jgi:hypothetical protein
MMRLQINFGNGDKFIIDDQSIYNCFSNVSMSFGQLYHSEELGTHETIDFNSNSARSTSIDRACPININSKRTSLERKFVFAQAHKRSLHVLYTTSATLLVRGAYWTSSK